MWEKVSSRSHNPIKIFPFGSYSDEVMLHGTVKYGLKSGGEKEIDWAARAKLVKEEGKVKLAFYQVYLVSGQYVEWRDEGEGERGLRIRANACIGYGGDGVI
jgi:hypothetical protein